MLEEVVEQDHVLHLVEQVDQVEVEMVVDHLDLDQLK
jgi:hypothetical protein